MFARFFIFRPIFASVLSILVTLGGVVGLIQLPVALYPEIAPPTIEVTTLYPGAHARTLADTVAAPIEEYVNGVEGMMYMTSTCTNDGMYTLTVTFKPGTDLNIAQVLVQNRINVAAPKLPSEVRRRGVLVKKKSSGVLLMINLVSPDGSKTDAYLSNHATIHIRDELARLDGIGDIVFLGQRDYSMRVWINPEKLAERNLKPEDITHAIEQQNAQVAAGQIGQPPVPRGQAMQLIINTPGRLLEPEQFENIVIKTDAFGRPIRLKDVTDQPKLNSDQRSIELGAVSYDQACTLDGKPSVALSIYQLPGSNAIKVADRVKTKMAELKTSFTPGVDYEIVYDTTPFINESVNEVFHTLRDAVILVAIVMLVFLQSWRSTIIPLAAVPVALVGTFGAMALLGFSLNTLTLFGLVLAVGIVVDDAIVVVEAVEHHMSLGLSSKDATVAAMNDVAGPVIAVGLVLAAVFVPCVFITGIIGEFFQQFAVTIAISTLLSAFNSLTLSPALCALLLKPHDVSKPRRDPLPMLFYFVQFVGLGYFATLQLLVWLDMVVTFWITVPLCLFFGIVISLLLGRVCNFILGWSFWLFNYMFGYVTRIYSRIVRVCLFITPIMLLAYCGVLAETWHLFTTTPTGFIPAQDKGYLVVNMQLTDASSLGRTQIAAAKVDIAARTIPGVTHTVAVSGNSALMGGNSSNFATLHIMLSEFGTRPNSIEIAKQLRAICQRDVPEATVTVLGAPPVDGLGVSGGYRLMIADRFADDASGMGLQRVAEQVVSTANEQHEFQSTFAGFRADMPWLELQFNRDKAKYLGVEINDVTRSMQTLYGSEYVNDFNRFGRTWQVNIQADPRYRNNLRGISGSVKVPTRTGEMIPLSDFVREKDTVGPVMVIRHNLRYVAPVTVSPSGTSSSEAIRKLEEVTKAKLEPGMNTEWTELALLQLQSGNTAAWALVLSIVLVFLVLAAQYESWTLPFVVILVVPMCLLSAVIGVRIAGLDINIFTQVGFVVLVGLACKNAILIVEYARKRRMAGASIREATIAACELRLRPIVMTSVAFILGVVPLVVAEGAGAEMRFTLGTAVFAGMIGVTLFGVFLTPVFYFAVQWATERTARWWNRGKLEEESILLTKVPVSGG